MKKLALFIFALVVLPGSFSNTFAQSYTVNIIADDVWWQSPENFGAWVNAIIYYNGTPISTSPDYFYEWDAFFGNEGYWRFFTSGYGEDGANISAETLPGYVIKLKVKVSDVVNHTFTNIQSGIAGPYSIPGVVPGDKGVNVPFIPYNQNGVNIYGTVTANH